MMWFVSIGLVVLLAGAYYNTEDEEEQLDKSNAQKADDTIGEYKNEEEVQKK